MSRHSASPIAPKMLLVAAVLLVALAEMANGDSTPACEKIEHLYKGNCVSYLDGLGADDFFPMNAIDIPQDPSQRWAAAEWQWSLTGALSLGNGKGNSLEQTADEFTVDVAKGGNSDATWVLVAEGTMMDNVVHGEFEVPFNQTFTAKASGKWALIVRNWADSPIADGAKWDPSSFTGTLRCADGNPIAVNTERTTAACPARIPEGKCKYDKVGFNPFERWNVFFTIRSGLTLGGTTSIEGRVAVSGKDSSIYFNDKAQVHTKVEPWISASASKWSLSAVGTQGVNFNSATASILNGGLVADSDVRVQGNIESGGTAANVAGEITKQTSSGVALAEEYFAARSTAWSRRASSVISSNYTTTTVRGTTSGTLKVRLHGKVNFLNVKATDVLANPLTIVLTGHPLGTLIVNVDHAGDFTMNPPPNYSGLTILVEDKEGNRDAPAFGRVLMNFFNAKAFYANYAGTTHASILAPFAQGSQSITSMVIKGNVIIGGGSYMSVDFQLAPFGMLPAKWLPPKPTTKKWTLSGKNAVACLWHEL